MGQQRIEIEPGQVWRSETLGMELRIRSVSTRQSSARHGSLRVEYIAPPYGNDGTNRMTKAWLRRHYRLASNERNE